MTIKNLYPKSRPTTIYNVINGRPELPASSVFSRASEGTYVDSGGLVKVAAADEPRFNYDQETGEFLGLLLEGPSQNLKLHSEDITKWSESKVLSTTTITPNYTTAPDGTLTADRYQSKIDPDQLNNSSAFGLLSLEYYTTGNGFFAISVWMKSNDGTSPKIYYQYASPTDYPGTRPTISPEWKRYVIKGQVNPITKLSVYLGTRGGSTGNKCSQDIDISIWGAQIEWQIPQPEESSYIPTTSSYVTREADEFSLTTSNNFDGGFSLLLDSDTTTEDYLYRIKAGGTVISELKNDGGTLEWDVNGTSAQSEGLYPQVGFVNGRVRTVSSFGAANGEIQNNYLYTTGLSFPTPAVVAPGADELEFGVPQTLKAVYVWNNQLASSEAIAVIKGNPGSDVNDIPVVGDPYIFVYNTDPTDVGETTIDLSGIVPTTSMRIYWGDGTTERLEKASDGTLPIPQHTYPYPGQYRVQIVSGDNLFDSVTLYNNKTIDNIIRVDQWAPQHRVGASGPGFTGDDMVNLLVSQSTCVNIPEFKYTDLTSLNSTFNNCGNVNDNAAYWPWIPTDLSLVTTLRSAFTNLARYGGSDGSDTKLLPQLTTGLALTDLRSCYGGSFVEGFFRPSDKAIVYTPWTNTSNVQYWSSCLTYYRGTQIDLWDMGEALNVDQMFYNSPNIPIIPAYNTSKCTSFKLTFFGCSQLISCGMDFSVAKNMNATFQSCISLVNPPAVNLPNATTCSTIYRECTNLSNITGWSAPNNTSYVDAFRETNIAVVPTFASSKVTSWYRAIYNCPQLTEFEPHDMSLVRNMESFVNGCQNFTTLPTDGSFKFPALTNCRSAFTGTSIVNFPASSFDTTDALETLAFLYAFNNTKLNVDSIENILVSLEKNAKAISANTGISLGIRGDDIAPRYQGAAADAGTTLNWSQAAEDAFVYLRDTAGWTIEYQKYVDQSFIPAFYVISGPDVVSFVESTEGAVESGQPNQEEFTDEGEALARVLELDENYFPSWDVNESYLVGERVQFRGSVYRALQQNDARELEIPGPEPILDVDASTPKERQAHWVEVYTSNYDEEMMMS